MVALAWGYWGCVHSGRYLGVHGVLVVFFFLIDVVVSFFVVFFTSSCSIISVPPALYHLLYCSGSSLLRGSVMYVIRLSIRGVISPVNTYRRCILDIWSTWR